MQSWAKDFVMHYNLKTTKPVCSIAWVSKADKYKLFKFAFVHSRNVSTKIQQLLLMLSHITYLWQTLLVVCEKKSCFNKENKLPLENNYHFLKAKCQVRLGARIKKSTYNNRIVY